MNQKPTCEIKCEIKSEIKSEIKAEVKPETKSERKKILCARRTLSAFVSAVGAASALLVPSVSSAVLGFEVAPNEVERIVIIGLEAQVQLLGQNGAQKVRVNGIDDTSEPGQYMLEKRDRTLFIKMQEYGDKNDWKLALTRPKAKHIIEFVGASVPVEVQVREGAVIAKNWSKDLRVAMVRGKVTTTGGSGTMNVQLQRGDISVQDQSSKLTTDLYRGQLTIKNLQGDLEASSFAGSINIEKSKGFMNLFTTQAVAKIQQSAGTLQFDNVKGNVITQQFSGRVDGVTADGSVNIGIVPDTDVHIKSTTGRVTVQTVAGSGAFVNALTSEGEIVAPNEVPTGKTATEKTARGRLRGSEQKGTIVVRSREGTIVIK